MNACLPAALAMMARGWNVQFLALTTAYAAVKDAGVPVWQARDLLGAQDGHIRAHGLRLAGDAPQGGPVSREETIAYHALGYHDLVAEHGEAGAAALYEQRGRAAFEHRELAARIMDRVRPDLVLTTNSPRAEKAVIDCAQARGVPAAVLNDTLASATNDWLHNPAYADRILVIADAVRDVLIASGHAPEKIIVTGNPALEPNRQGARHAGHQNDQVNHHHRHQHDRGRPGEPDQGARAGKPKCFAVHTAGDRADKPENQRASRQFGDIFGEESPFTQPQKIGKPHRKNAKHSINRRDKYAFAPARSILNTVNRRPNAERHWFDRQKLARRGSGGFLQHGATQLFL